jgi:hypothetical protein
MERESKIIRKNLIKCFPIIHFLKSKLIFCLEGNFISFLKENLLHIIARDCITIYTQALIKLKPF